MDPLQPSVAKAAPEVSSPVTEHKSSTSCWNRRCMRCFRACCFSVQTDEARSGKELAARAPPEPQKAATSTPRMFGAKVAPDQAHSSNYTGHTLSGAVLHSTLSSNGHRGRSTSLDSGAGAFVLGGAGSDSHSKYAGDLSSSYDATYSGGGHSSGDHSGGDYDSGGGSGGGYNGGCDSGGAGGGDYSGGCDSGVGGF